MFVAYYLPLLIWMGIIFYFSSKKGSGYPMKTWQFYMERKGAHIAEYFLLAVLFLRIFFLGRFDWISRQKKYLPYASAFVFSFIFAVSDEFHQYFIFGREGKISDIGIDVIGIILALLAYWIAMKQKVIHRNKD